MPSDDKPLFVIRGDKIYCAHSRITIFAGQEDTEWHCQNPICKRKFKASEIFCTNDGNWELKDERSVTG